MATFPTLSTGAVLQYPANKTYSFSTHVVQFIDGAEQRFRDRAQYLHRWIVTLDLLTDSEMNGLREFFRIQNGAAGQFSFTDPWDGAVYANCSLETDEMTEVLEAEGQGKTALVIRENPN
jgi:phage-related protein